MFDSSRYAPAIADLVSSAPLNPLGPGTPSAALRPLLSALTIDNAFAPHRVRDRNCAQACRAGLWLLHDFLDEAHCISQDLSTVEGSFWHAIMHRREPDFGNSKYWCRRVGKHPVFELLWRAAAELATDAPPQARFLTTQSSWDPFRFVDLCEAAYHGRADCDMLCREIQRQEWQLLFDFCYRRALGES